MVELEDLGDKNGRHNLEISMVTVMKILVYCGRERDGRIKTYRKREGRLKLLNRNIYVKVRKSPGFKKYLN